jgi:hypothetical protein
MWPYTVNELAFINNGASINTPKEKKMSYIDSIVEFYRNTANVVLAYVPNKEAKEVFTKIVDVQVDLVKASNNAVANAMKNFAPVK